MEKELKITFSIDEKNVTVRYDDCEDIIPLALLKQWYEDPRNNGAVEYACETHIMQWHKTACMWVITDKRDRERQYISPFILGQAYGMALQG